jgi:hypothetical protein
VTICSASAFTGVRRCLVCVYVCVCVGVRVFEGVPAHAVVSGVGT